MATVTDEAGPTPQHDGLSADNPFAAPSTLPFETPPFDRIRHEHFAPAFHAGMAEHLAEVRAIATDTKRPNFRNTIEALERAGALLGRVSSVFFHLTGAHSDDRLRELQSEFAPLLAAHRDRIWLDRELFARVQAVYDARDSITDPEQRRLTERYHVNFVRNGARLPSESQDRLRTINELTSSLVTDFQNALLADTKALGVLVDSEAELAGLDASSISAAAGAASAAGHEGKYLLTLELPSSQRILTSLDDRALRRRVFEASLARCSRGNQHDTRAMITKLATLRAERAALLGHATHADYVLADEMAGSAAAVRQMLGSMTGKIVAKAAAEAAELQAHLDEHHPGTKLEPWDWSWVAERVRKARYELDENEVKPYFELERVLQDGMFFVANQLYGITLKERHDLPVYHPDVRVFEVFDHDDESIGLFYADYYRRASKRGGAWMNNFVEQSRLLRQQPVVLNVMNIQKPGEGQPTLLNFDEVTTLFHEFGHGVHGLFSDVRYPLLSGTNVPRDFVEFPSQFHEDFAFDPRVLERCAKHYETGEPIPAELLQKIRNARQFGQGFASFEYLAAAWLDLAWHAITPDTEIDDVEAFERDALSAAGMQNPHIPPRYRSAYFSHIFAGGYSAGYYAYIWSEALAADGFEGVMQDGGMNRENGQRFREAVLSRGLTADPMQMYVEFRGRELDTGALLRRRGIE